MKKDRPLKTPRFQITFFDPEFKAGVVKPYDKNRKVLSSYKQYFENGKIQEACLKSLKEIGNIHELIEPSEEYFYE